LVNSTLKKKKNNNYLPIFQNSQAGIMHTLVEFVFCKIIFLNKLLQILQNSLTAVKTTSL